ncbi:MAG: tetratricopeptide repeat protein, partial [Planctomycetaceae bacterium]
MSEHQTTCEAALLSGAWDRAVDAALAWARHREPAGRRDPRPHFVLNVVQLLKGQFAEAWTSHALSLQDADDIARVKAWLDELVSGHVDQAAAHLVMGLFLSQSGQSELSMQSYRTAAQLAPHSAYPHYFLAQIHERANHVEMAIKEYREAVRLDPAYAPARTNLGVAYQEQGRLEMAIPQYREVIKLNPNDAVAHANLACALAEQGKL